MSVLSIKDYEFLNVEVGGVSYPPSPAEVILPEMEDPYFEISYPDGTVLFATGNVFIVAKLREEQLQVIEGGLKEKPESRKSRVRKLHEKKGEEEETDES